MKEECECVNCGHKWNQRIEDPATCPRCKSYNWKGKELNKVEEI